jgi:arylsulfatase A-like enzyme
VSGRPDVVIVVLDCARYPDYPFGGRDGLNLRCASDLLAESVVFPKSTAVAPWTLPSHSSLLSGRYFWRAGKERAGTDERAALPSVLRASGYSTFALLANPILGNDPALCEGFGASRTADWWEPYLRIARSESSGRTSVGRHRWSLPPGHPTRRAAELLIQASLRYPSAPRLASRTLDRIVNGGEPSEGVVAPWIEGAFEDQLARTSHEQPFFGLVNLMDAHEPYLVPRGSSVERPPMRSRQDRVGWLTGRWHPSSSELVQLRDAYHGRLELLDRRLGRLVGALKRAGRWDNCLTIVTSDHGQCFGEHGMMFHSQRVDEQLIRIPLLAKFPHGTRAGEVGTGWASLVDITPTVLDAVGLPLPAGSDGRPLPSLIDRERDTPVFAVSTGVDPRHLNALSAERRAQLGGTRVAAYFRSWKLVSGPGREKDRLFNLEQDPEEQEDLYGRVGAPAALTHALGTLDAPSELTGLVDGPAAQVEARLASWGY